MSPRNLHTLFPGGGVTGHEGRKNAIAQHFLYCDGVDGVSD
jgi:hypothetical protein